jgi:glycosyltransferase involved in cell wall biosynthesis
MGVPTLRILQVMRAPVGGLFRHVADLTRELDARGHSVGLAVDSLANDAQTEARLAALLPHARLGIHRMAMPRLLGVGDFKAPFAVRRLVRALDIDILHGHGAKGGFYARLAQLGGGKGPALYTPHGGILHFSRSSPSGRTFHLLERGLMARTGAIIFESAYAQATYTALIGPATCPTEIIHNGLAPEEFKPVAPAADAADFVFIGELRDLKGIFVLVRALATVVRKDGAPATLVMAGDGPARQELETLIVQLGLDERVQLLGAQPARPTFARGRIAVVPSLAESLPYVVLEAAAARLPVIATRVGGIPEIFGPTEASLVAAGDPAALAEAMQAALDHPEATQAALQARLNHIESHFSLAIMADGIEALYRRILAQS